MNRISFILQPVTDKIMVLSYKLNLLVACIVAFIFPFAIFADDEAYNKLIKRKIVNKMIEVENLIKQRDLGSFITLSLVIDDKIIYCHYKKENRSKFKLVMCY